MPVAKEQGFVLLESLVAGLALLVMAACFALFARSMELEVADGCRVLAIFLARTQFAAAQADASESRLHAGSYPWQGEAEDLQDGRASYTVQTHINGAGDGEAGSGIYKVSVHVAWHGEAAWGQLDLEREVVEHGRRE